jgi:hypothetical protein
MRENTKPSEAQGTALVNSSLPPLPNTVQHGKLGAPHICVPRTHLILLNLKHRWSGYSAEQQILFAEQHIQREATQRIPGWSEPYMAFLQCQDPFVPSHLQDVFSIPQVQVRHHPESTGDYIQGTQQYNISTPDIVRLPESRQSPGRRPAQQLPGSATCTL